MKRFENRLPPAQEKQNDPIDGVILDGDITATTFFRLNTTGYDNTRCIICQEQGGKLRTVRFIKTGQRMLEEDFNRRTLIDNSTSSTQEVILGKY